jgi:hypothetical protein
MAEKSSPGTRQTDGKNLVWFGEIERKLAKLSMPILTVLPLNYFMGRTTEYTDGQAFCPVVRIGSPHLFTPKRVLLPLPFRSMGETHSAHEKRPLDKSRPLIFNRSVDKIVFTANFSKRLLDNDRSAILVPVLVL